MLATEAWPEWDDVMTRRDTATLVVQVNGKVRDRVEVDADIDAATAEATALGLERIRDWIEGKEVTKIVARPPRLVNIVVKG